MFMVVQSEPHERSSFNCRIYRFSLSRWTYMFILSIVGYIDFDYVGGPICWKSTVQSIVLNEERLKNIVVNTCSCVKI